MIPAATSASTAASSSGSVSWPPQRARNASQAPAKHFFFSHISCPNFSKNLSRHTGIPAFAALFWKKATKTGVMAGLLGGFVVCVGWKLAGQPFGLGAAVPGTVACGIALVVVSLATYKRAPSVFLKAEKQS